jgi:hypothetical protein
MLRIIPFRTTVTACLLAALSLAGCNGGSSGSSGPSAQHLNLTGTYRINAVSNLSGPYTGIASFVHNGSTLTGDFQSQHGLQGRIRGTVTGTHFQGDLISTNSPVSCQFEGDFFPDGTVGRGQSICNSGEVSTFTTVKV